MASRPSILDWSTFAALTAAWGSSFVMTKVAVGHFDPSWVMALRLCIAAIFMTILAMILGKRFPSEVHWWAAFAWYGLIGHALPFFLLTWGTQFVTSGLAGVFMGLIPLVVIVLAHFMLPDEPLTITKALGFVIGFAGLVIVLGPEKLLGLSLSGNELKGELAILASCVCYALHAIAARRKAYPDLMTQAAGVLAMGSIVGLASALFMAGPAGLAAPASAWLAVIGLGLIPTALALLLVYRLLGRTGTTLVSYANYLVPVVALAFGAVLLGEKIELSVAAGLAIILAGIGISRFPPRRFTK